MASNKIARESDMKIIADEVIGHADISEIGDGTTRGAIKEIDGELETVKENIETHNGQIGDLESDVATVKEHLGDAEVAQKGLELFGWIAPVIGTVKDTIENGVYHKRVARVDLNKLSGWTYNSSFDTYIVPFTNAKLPTNNTVVANIISDKYTVTYANGHNGGVNNTISLAANNNGQLFVKDSSLGTNGTPTGYLYYELAQEQTYSIYNPNVFDTIGTATNLLNPTLQSQVVNGITVTRNSDNSFTLNGTASDVTYIYLAKPLKLTKGKYKLLGHPRNSNNGYYIYTLDYVFSSTYIEDIVAEVNDGYSSDLLIRVASGTVLQNELIKPMITTNLQAQYSDFVPFTGSTGKLNSDVAEMRIKYIDYLIDGTEISTASNNIYYGIVNLSSILPSNSIIINACWANPSSWSTGLYFTVLGSNRVIISSVNMTTLAGNRYMRVFYI